MKGPKATSIAHKKLEADMMKKRKADAKKENASKKNSGAPKRPASAFFVFMEDFRKTFKENFPDNKSVSVVGKAGGEKWKSMSDSEKAPYVAKAAKKKAEYEKAKEEFNMKINGNGANEKPEESEKSSSDVHDEAEQEASS
uniref:Putative high mobility group B protein 3-like n=1 Tax=Davidia involucrata TaxID=16924 RepID=A0A5B7BCI3_DAVIN